MSLRAVGKLLIIAMSAIAVGIQATATSAQSCPGSWSDAFGTDGPDGSVETMIEVDDDGVPGTPPVLILAGAFTRIGGIWANHVARWDGTTWTTFGSGLSGTVSSLAYFDEDGLGPAQSTLFAAGSFVLPDSGVVARVAKWTGTTWIGVGGSFSSSASILTVGDIDGPGPLPESLIVGGFFQTIGGLPCPNIARLENGNWVSIGNGLNSVVKSLCMFDDDGRGGAPPRLFAGGLFSASGATPMNYIARFNGTAWEAVVGNGNGPAGTVQSLQVADLDGTGPAPNTLIAAGEVSNPTGIPPGRVTQWDGSTWTTLGADMSSYAWASEVFDHDNNALTPPALFVCGSFTQVGGAPCQTIARWDGAVWQTVGGGLVGSATRSLHAFDADGAGPLSTRLLAGGFFELAGGQAIHSLAAWDGAAWAAVVPQNDHGITNVTFSISSFDEDGPGGLPTAAFVGSNSRTAGGDVITFLARWQEGEWSTVGPGFIGTPSAMLVRDDDGNGPNAPVLYIAGPSTTTDGTPLNRIMTWDGQSLAPLSQGLGSFANALVDFDHDNNPQTPPLLIAGGSFTTAGGQPANRVAAWNGQTWSTLGFGFISTVRSLAVFDDDGDGPLPPRLYAGGDFTGGLARWNGTSWTSLAFNGAVLCITHFDDDGSGPHPTSLYVGGQFTNINGSPFSYAAKWNGSAWSALGSPGLNSWCRALEVFDADGTGPEPAMLYATGDFNVVDGQPMPRIARWNGTGWQGLGSGMNSAGTNLHAFDSDGAGPIPPRLLVGGFFTVAGGESAQQVTAWVGCSNTRCPADIDGDQQVNVSDLLDVITGWGACPSPCPPKCTADIVPDCTVNVSDLLAVITHWGACP